MARTSTRRKPSAPPTQRSGSQQRGGGGLSERLLLVAILALGVVGLAISYGSRRGEGAQQSANAVDSTTSDGKLQRDRMILNLNQRTTDDGEEERAATSRF